MSVLRAFAMRADLPRTPVLAQDDLPDLTTAPDRAAGTVAPDALHVAPPKELWTPLPRPVPGTRFTGTLPDDHAARFVLRVPRDWDGRLVVAAASGITDERTYDLWLSDYLLSRGCAFAATDKAVRRAVLDGDTVLMPHTPENSIRRWPERLEALARTAAALCEKARGRRPSRTYAAGLSNGGWIARKAAEGASGLFDGAFEVSGVLWRADAGGVLRELPAALRATAKTPWDRGALARAGFPVDGGRWEPVLAQYRAVYWEAVMHLFLNDLDPAYSGPVCHYDLDSRPASVRDAIRSFENTGDLKVPLVSVAGRMDSLIPCAGHAEAYAALVRSKGKAALHRLTVVADAGHIDTNAADFPFMRPLMPEAHAAFEALVARVEAPAPALS